MGRILASVPGYPFYMYRKMARNKNRHSLMANGKWLELGNIGRLGTEVLGKRHVDDPMGMNAE